MVCLAMWHYLDVEASPVGQILAHRDQVYYFLTESCSKIMLMGFGLGGLIFKTGCHFRRRPKSAKRDTSRH